MSYYEGAYSQLLFGVSQQQPKDRLEGQVTEQVNMTSDPAFGVRRRPPVRVLSVDLSKKYRRNQISSYQTDISGQAVYVIADAYSGAVDIYNDAGTLLQSLSDEYIQTGTKDNLQFATVDNALYLANLSVKPREVPSEEQAAYPDPTHYGYLYLLSSAYSKNYRMIITRTDTGQQWSVDYLTPEGASPEEVAEATLEYIAEELVRKANGSSVIGSAAGFTYWQEGGYISVYSENFPVTVTTDSGSQYAKASGSSVNSTSDLPARLPGETDGYIVTVGTGQSKTYYRWVASSQSWLEDAAYDAQTRLTDMPKRLRYVEDAWVLESVDWERRSAGDAETNPTLHFVSHGITGIGAFQGRLVLLSDEFVCMSASNRPERWYRSTVESVEDDDPIEVAGQARLASPYVRAVVFNKDLVVFSRRYQGIVPGGGAITPSNATIAVVSHYEAQTGAAPVPTGQSMFFASRRSIGYSSVWEITPSPYVDSSIVGQDVTNHIPTYIPSEVQFMTTSSSSGIMVAGLVEDGHTLLVHEYLWSGNEKKQQAWHKWTFEHELLDAVFIGDRLNLLFNLINGGTAMAVLDLRAGAGDAARETPRLDFQMDVLCGRNGRIQLTTEQLSLWGTNELRVFKKTGDYMYTAQTPSRDGGELIVLSAKENDILSIGRPYTSTLIPTQPVVRDRNDRAITTQRAALHKYVVQLQNTGEFSYRVSDKYRTGEQVDISALNFGSPELGVGIPLVADGQVFIPARVDMQTSRLELTCSDVYDMNITNLEYGYRFSQRYGRRA